MESCKHRVVSRFLIFAPLAADLWKPRPNPEHYQRVIILLSPLSTIPGNRIQVHSKGSGVILLTIRPTPAVGGHVGPNTTKKRAQRVFVYVTAASIQQKLVRGGGLQMV